jgi:hypothetical protein
MTDDEYLAELDASIENLEARIRARQAEVLAAPPPNGRATADSIRAKPPSRGEAARIEFKEPVCITDLKAVDLDREWLWRGVLALRAVTLFSALFKAGKTTLLAHLMAATGTGKDLCGLAVKPCKVLLISEEPQGLWAERRDVLGIGPHLDVIERPFLTKPDPATWLAWVEFVAGLCRSKGYNLVVLDTISNLWPVLHENDAAEVQAALMPLRQVTDLGVSLLLVHHFRKSGGEEATGSRGSGALAGFVDIILELRRYDARDKKDRRRVLTGFGRYRDVVDELVVELADDGKGYTAQGDRQQAHRHDRKDAIAELLPEEPPGWTVQEVLAAWTETPKPGRRTLELDLKDGADRGEWAFTGKGGRHDPWRYYWK